MLKNKNVYEKTFKINHSEYKKEGNEEIIEIVLKSKETISNSYFLLSIAIFDIDSNKKLSETNLNFQKFNQKKELFITDREIEKLISFLLTKQNIIESILSEHGFGNTNISKTIISKLKDRKEKFKNENSTNFNETNKTEEKIELEEVKNHDKWLIIYLSNTIESHSKNIKAKNIKADNKREVEEYLWDLVNSGVKKKNIRVYSPEGKILTLKPTKEERIQRTIHNLKKIENAINGLNEYQTHYLNEVFNDLLRLKEEL